MFTKLGSFWNTFKVINNLLNIYKFRLFFTENDSLFFLILRYVKPSNTISSSSPILKQIFSFIIDIILELVQKPTTFINLKNILENTLSFEKVILLLIKISLQTNILLRIQIII